MKLAQDMEDRRVALGLRWADVANRAGMSTMGLRQVRQGTSEIRALTRRAIEDALEWERGSVTEVLGGGEPKPATRTWTGREVRQSSLDRIREDVERNEILSHRDKRLILAILENTDGPPPLDRAETG